MRRFLIFLVPILMVGCSRKQAIEPTTSQRPESLVAARHGHVTKLLRQERGGEPVTAPPSGFELVIYPSPAGEMAAYVHRNPAPGKHPAIIWIFGGFDNGIGDTAWAPATPDNDQSGRAFWQAGIVTMYPSFRGGNENPGFKEAFYGEVDDVVAAAEWLAKQPYVDPKRIYLGGHSTGGTLALLAAASSDRFRAVFAFGPVADVSRYGQENLPFDIADRKEVQVRSPVYWVHNIQCPTVIYEGSEGGNVFEVEILTKANQRLRGEIAQGYDHFSILAAYTPAIAKAILSDTGPRSSIGIPRPGG